MRLISAYLIGLIFGVGIAVSGMMNPAKVLNFFDFAGSWDPSLIFVMAGGLVVATLGYRFVLPRPAPLLGERFMLPQTKAIDARLIGGSAVFGIGWGLSGFCPGGALPALGTGRLEVYIFVATVVAGILLAKMLNRIGSRPAAFSKA